MEREWSRLQSLFMQAPALICILRGPEHVMEFANPPFLALLGGRAAMGRPIREAFPELEGQGLFDLLDGVYRTGEPFVGKEAPNRLDLDGDGVAGDRYFDFVYQPTRDEADRVDGIFVHAVEVTDRVGARHRIESLVEQLTTERDRLRSEVAAREQAEKEIRERARQAALGAAVGAALTSAEGLQVRLQRCAEALVRHLDAAFARIWTLNDADQILELRASAGQYTHLDGPHGRVPVGRFKIGMIAQERRPHLTNQVLGDPQVGDQEWARREGMVAFAGYPLLVGGHLVGVMGLFARHALSTETLAALGSIADGIAVGIDQARIEDERNLLHRRERQARDEAETLLRTGSALAAELDLTRLVQSATEAATEISGAQFGAFFYNVIDAQGEHYTLYTIAGVPREEFSKFPMPRNTKVFAPTFAGEGVVRLDDVTRDPRYGQNPPYHGMPAGHLPVRSYLAVPVVSRRGEVLGGLFFGHASPGVFTERAERLVVGIAAQAAVAIDNARLYSAERAAQEDLRRQAEQLAAANRELEAFSYSVSHDLRAPLRAMDGFSRILLEEYADALPEDGRRYLQIVRDSAHQMGALVDDLLAFSRLGRQALEPRAVQPAQLARDAWADLRHEWEGRPVELLIRDLPTAHGDPTLLRLVFLNLLGNAAKFTRGRSPSVIEVGAERLDEEVAYFVQDNGVGFDMKYHDKVFGVFQRLHRAEDFEGTGVGLAIAQRIVHRHGGRIWARSTPGSGTTFYFTLGRPPGDVVADDD